MRWEGGTKTKKHSIMANSLAACATRYEIRAMSASQNLELANLLRCGGMVGGGTKKKESARRIANHSAYIA